jgi:hypothetical protein
LEKILKNRLVVVTEYFYPTERNDAILITEDEKYIGYLSSKVLLEIINRLLA